MALLTPLSLPEAETIGRLFAIEVVAVESVPHGSVNSNFALTLAGDGRAFLRVYEESTAAEVAEQNRLLAHLVARGVPTPAPRQRADGGGTLAEHRGKPVAVFPFCPGSWICQRAVTESHAGAVGAALAHIHQAGADFSDPPPTRFGPRQLSARLEDLRGRQLDPELGRVVERLAARLAEVSAAARDFGEPAIIHGDVFRDNVLWHHDGRLSAVLDFESASRGHPAFDLMVAMHAWCFGDRFEQALVRALLAGYRSVRRLAKDELAACYPQARAAAVRFAITRITDYELRPRDRIVYKDYRRFVARLEAVEAIGQDRFGAWLDGG